MNEFLKNALEEIKGQTYISSIPIEEFSNKEELVVFAKIAKEKKIGTALHYETSNFYQGVIVEIFDKDTCEVKDYLGIMR
ncbi:MAG: hypothetical protein K1W24_01590 [Lachnospiraceae bacterium]